MKKTLSILIILVLSFSAHAQTKDTVKHTDSLIFKPVDTDPQFPGGIAAFYKFLSKNQKYPDAAKQNNIHGKVFLTFVVEKDGSLSGITVVRSLSPEIDAEAIRLMQISPKWNPGLQNGQPVRVRYTMPVLFQIPGQ
jgi:protein TonB